MSIANCHVRTREHIHALHQRLGVLGQPGNNLVSIVHAKNLHASMPATVQMRVEDQVLLLRPDALDPKSLPSLVDAIVVIILLPNSFLHPPPHLLIIPALLPSLPSGGLDCGLRCVLFRGPISFFLMLSRLWLVHSGVVLDRPVLGPGMPQAPSPGPYLALQVLSKTSPGCKALHPYHQHAHAQQQGQAGK